MNWILVILIGSGWGLSDLKISNGLTEAQCKSFVREMHSAGGHVAGLCIGPNGETYSSRTIER